MQRRPRRNPPERAGDPKTAETRERLLRAALDLVSEKGYTAACTRDIARRAGFCELTLYRHFGSKERLFGQMLASYTFLPRLKGLLPTVSDMPVEQALTVIGLRFMETLRERKALVRIILSEVPTHPAEIREAFTGVISQIRSILEGYLNRRRIRSAFSRAAVRDASRVFLGSLFSTFMIEEIFRGRSLARRETAAIVRGTVRIILDGLADRTGTTRQGKGVSP